MQTSSIARIMKMWVGFVMTLYLVAPSSTSIDLRIVGVLFLAALFFPLLFLEAKPVDMEFGGSRLRFLSVVFILVCQLILVQYAITFYTGSSLEKVLQNSLSGGNAYSEYQDYFRGEGVADFSLEKIPAIASLAFIKIIFLYLYSIAFFGRAPRPARFAMFFSAVPVIFMALARGTFFEIFEIGVVIFYGLALKINRLRLKHLAWTGAAAVLFFILFMLNTIRRYESAASYFESSCATTMYCFEPVGLDFYVEYAIYLLSTYFAMGAFFLSKYLSIVADGKFLTSLSPLMSLGIFGVLENGLEKNLCASYLDCRAVWMPELISWISALGLVLVCPVLWRSLQWLNSIEIHAARKKSVCAFPLMCLLLIYFLSLPVGKFWTVSSQNILSTAFFLVCWFIKNGRSREHLA